MAAADQPKTNGGKVHPIPNHATRVRNPWLLLQASSFHEIPAINKSNLLLPAEKPVYEDG